VEIAVVAPVQQKTRLPNLDQVGALATRFLLSSVIHFWLCTLYGCVVSFDVTSSRLITSLL
jgi:hypothetical protein